MKQTLIRLAAALILTLPIYIGIAHIGPVENWFTTGSGWAAFDPLFRLCNAIGIGGDARILTNAMLFVSFIVALAAVWIGTLLIDKVRLTSAKS